MSPISSFWTMGRFTDDNFWLLCFMTATSINYAMPIITHNWPFTMIAMPWVAGLFDLSRRRCDRRWFSRQTGRSSVLKHAVAADPCLHGCERVTGYSIGIRNWSSTAVPLDRRLVPAGRDVDRRMDNRKLVVHCRFRRMHDIEDELLLVHRADRADLNRLIVDDDESRILRCQKVVGVRVADGFACHGIFRLLFVECTRLAKLKGEPGVIVRARPSVSWRRHFPMRRTCRSGNRASPA